MGATSRMKNEVGCHPTAKAHVVFRAFCATNLSVQLRHVQIHMQGVLSRRLAPTFDNAQSAFTGPKGHAASRRVVIRQSMDAEAAKKAQIEAMQALKNPDVQARVSAPHGCKPSWSCP
jgi:hypothetical protein